VILQSLDNVLQLLIRTHASPLVNASTPTAEIPNHLLMDPQQPVTLHQLVPSIAHLDNTIPLLEPTRAQYATSQMVMKLQEPVLRLSAALALEVLQTKEPSATSQTPVLMFQVPECTNKLLRLAELSLAMILAHPASSASGTEMSLTAHILAMALQIGHVECITDTPNIHTGILPPATILAQLLQVKLLMCALITLLSAKMLQLSTIAPPSPMLELASKMDASGTIQSHSSPRNSATHLTFPT